MTLCTTIHPCDSLRSLMIECSHRRHHCRSRSDCWCGHGSCGACCILQSMPPHVAALTCLMASLARVRDILRPAPCEHEFQLLAFPLPLVRNDLPPAAQSHTAIAPLVCSPGNACRCCNSCDSATPSATPILPAGVATAMRLTQAAVKGLLAARMWRHVTRDGRTGMGWVGSAPNAHAARNEAQLAGLSAGGPLTRDPELSVHLPPRPGILHVHTAP